MNLRHSAWLAALQAASRGGARAQLDPIVRNSPWAPTITFEADYSSSTFSGALSTEPDDGVSKVVDFTVDVGAFEDGKTKITLSLTAAQTDAITADDDGDGVLTLLWDLHQDGRFLMGGIVPVLGATSDV